MAGPVFVAAGAYAATASSSSKSSQAPALPGSLATGQILIGIATSKNTGAHTWSAPWTLKAQIASGSGWSVSWATLIASTATTVPTVTFGTAGVVTAQIFSYGRSLDTATTPSAGTSGSSLTTPHTSPSITTTRSYSRCIYIDACAVNTALTVATGYTSELATAGSSSATHIDVGGKTVNTPGTATGNISTIGGAAAWVQFQIELLSPPETGGGTIYQVQQPQWR